jgi:hypothetical protein
MVPLGWIGGVVGLILATAISLYANALIAMLHEFGGTRHIRYRDLAGYIYGKLCLLIVYNKCMFGFTARLAETRSTL